SSAIVIHACGGKPSPVTIALSTPICSMSGPRSVYTNFQITEAPTNEIAIGMKISDLAILPHQSRSASTAMTSPNDVANSGTTNSQARLFSADCQKMVSVSAQP